MLVAKVHKISERVDHPVRRAAIDKDAFDIYRILPAVDVSELASEVRLLQANRVSSDVDHRGADEVPRTPSVLD